MSEREPVAEPADRVRHIAENAVSSVVRRKARALQEEDETGDA